MLKGAATLLLSLALVFTVGCESMTQVQKGAAIGGAIGAGVGAAVGATPIQRWSSGEGAIGGAVIGGLIGALVGDMNAEAQEVQAHIDHVEDLNAKLAACEEALRKCEANSANQADTITKLEARIAELERQLAVALDELAKCKGVRVEMSLSNDVLFGSGSAVLTSGGRAALDEAAKKIKDAHMDKKIQVEGHTDSDPISASNWRSNWELGAARALAVLHYLNDAHGIKAETLSASTYSMYKPVASNDTAAGKSDNRRSVIVLYTAWPTN